jgi:hypothetical protein
MSITRSQSAFFSIGPDGWSDDPERLQQATADRNALVARQAALTQEAEGMRVENDRLRIALLFCEALAGDLMLDRTAEIAAVARAALEAPAPAEVQYTNWGPVPLGERGP